MPRLGVTAIAVSCLLLAACGERPEASDVSAQNDAVEVPAGPGAAAPPSSVQVAEHSRTYQVERLPDGLAEYARDSRSIPGTIDSLLEQETGGTEASQSSEPISVSTTVLFAADGATGGQASTDSAERPTLAMTLSSLPAGTTIEDQRAALSAPDRVATLREAGYSRDIIDMGTFSAELLTRGPEATLRWWDDKGSVYFRAHQVEVDELVSFAGSVE